MMMMVSKKYVLATALVTVAMAASAAQPAAGLIEVHPDGTRTFLTTERLDRNAHVVAQYAQAQDAAQCCVVLRVLGAKRQPVDVSDALNGKRVRAYALTSSRAADAVPFVGAALVLKARDKAAAAGEVALLADPTGKLFPVVCTSSEGVHLLQLNDDRPQAHLYLHFSYAVEPTCSETLLKKFH